ncbi:alpha/beta hydrolase family protein [Deefgea rivuli]|uniref:alpha/beta hydrolase family protein n=1 Tax=Deefgea rivuli TaxID=400948 RepID=UPI000688A6AA|nr:alpha/beta fold hydrolase [Deefgea rivuli]
MTYRVGSQTLYFVDASRLSWAGEGARPMLLDVWYPAVDSAVEQTHYFGGDEPLFQIEGIAKDAPLLVGQWPLIVLSHGTGGSGLQMGWLGRYLASHGFVAVAISHHGNTCIEPYLPQGFLLWWERATDLSRVIDFMLAHSDFGAVIAAEKIAAAGFSLGGYTALAVAGGICDLSALYDFCGSDERDASCDAPPEFSSLLAMREQLIASDPAFNSALQRHAVSYKDSRVRAALLLSPALGRAFTSDGVAQIDIPLHIVVAAGDQIAPAKSNGMYLAQLMPEAKLTVLDEAVNHYVYLCEATPAGKQYLPELCCDDARVDRRLIHQQTAALAVEFFRSSGIGL